MIDELGRMKLTFEIFKTLWKKMLCRYFACVNRIIIISKAKYPGTAVAYFKPLIKIYSYGNTFDHRKYVQ